jgi:DNA-binding MarR family transcriptional regulator
MNGVIPSYPRPNRLLKFPVYSMASLYKPAYARLEAALAEIGLSVRIYQILAILDEFGGLSQQQVADRMLIDRSDMVRVLDRLEELGYVVRVRDAVDRRRHVLTMTPVGQDAMMRAEPVVGRVNDETFARLSGEERQTLHRLILVALGESTEVLDRAIGEEQDRRAREQTGAVDR